MFCSDMGSGLLEITPLAFLVSLVHCFPSHHLMKVTSSWCLCQPSYSGRWLVSLYFDGINKMMSVDSPGSMSESGIQRRSDIPLPVMMSKFRMNRQKYSTRHRVRFSCRNWVRDCNVSTFNVSV